MKDAYLPISMGFLKTRRDWDDIFSAINQTQAIVQIIHRKTVLHIRKRDVKTFPGKKKKERVREITTITTALEKI